MIFVNIQDMDFIKYIIKTYQFGYIEESPLNKTILYVTNN